MKTFYIDESIKYKENIYFTNVLMKKKKNIMHDPSMH
jgi:hypothetical protein